MEENQIYKKINENLFDMENVENEIAKVELAIYQKSIDEVKNKKISEIREFLEQSAKTYNQKIEHFDYEVNDSIKKYEAHMQKLIKVYDNLYLTTFKLMQNAINNQKIAIGNIATLIEQSKEENLKEEQISKIKNNIIACIEKKLNYAVIVEECDARIKWCIENVQNDINEIFVINSKELQQSNENIVIKIRKKLHNLMFGKSDYIKFLTNYEKEYLREIESKNNNKILEIAATTKGVTMQMEEAKRQILKKYEEKIAG